MVRQPYARAWIQSKTIEKIANVPVGKKNLTGLERTSMTTILRNFWNDEQGQDLIEYTLLMAFVALASAALFLGAGGSIKGIWSTSNSQLVAANSMAS
jgi:Flp pilus assembly pilin Flp